MKRLLFLLILAIGIAAYVYRDAIVPVLAPVLPQPIAAWLAPAPASGDVAADKPADKGGEKAGEKGKGGGKRGGGGPAAVVVALTQTQSMPILRQTVGTVVPVANTSLASQTPGFVLDIHVKDGADVKAGDILFSLDDRAIQALMAKDRATLAKDQALLDDANRKLASVQKLVASGVYNQQQGDDALAAVKVAEAAIVVDKAVLAADEVTLSNTKIKAPFDGRIGAILVSRGAFVGSGTAMATITEMAPVFAEFTLSETDLALARSAMAANALTVNVVPTMSVPDTKPVSGPVVFIDNSVDQGSGTFKMRAQLGNEDGQLWPGQALRVEVHAGDMANLTTFPVVAMIQTAQGAAVNVVKADNTVEVRPIVPALKVGDTVGVASGLAAGEQVVVEGQLNLANGTAVKIVDPKATAVNGAPSQGAASDGSASPLAGSDPGKPADGADPAAGGKHHHKKDGSTGGAQP